MGSLNFEPSDKDIEFVEALLEGLDKYAKHLEACKHCLHFDKDESKCDKIHHCDCDCPECSPESYV